MGALFVFHTCTFGQADSLPTHENTSDSLIRIDEEDIVIESEPEDEPLKVYTVHNTKVAIICSAIIPGLGQAYNRKYWKIPLIYGGGTLLYFFYDLNNFQYQKFKSAYNNPDDITDPRLIDRSPTEIQLYMNYSRRNRDLVVIGMGLLYVANIVDAMVDSYMTEYDISKDLSMKVSPTILQPSPVMYASAPGLKMSLRF